MPRRSSNWDAYRTRSSTPGRGARRWQVGSAARRTVPQEPPPQPTPQQTISTKVKAVLAGLLVTVAGSVTLAVSEHVQSLTGDALDWITTRVGSDPPGHLTVSSVTPMYVNAGGTVIYARPTHLTEQQMEHAANTLTGPGAVVPNSTAEKVVLTNTGSSTVYVTNIAVHKTCTSPLTGTILYDPPGGNGGGPTGTVGVGFDLDSPHPLAQTFNADTLKLSGRYFLSHDLPVVKDVPQTLVLFARTSRYYCHYSYEITLRSNGKQTTQKIPAKGRSFEITADLIAKKSSRPLASYQTAYVPGYQAITARGAQKTSSSSPYDSFTQVNPKSWKPPQ